MWLDNFGAWVQAHPTRTAVVTDGGTYTYQELWELSAAAGLQALREHPHARHLIAQSDPLACLTEVIGAWIHGKVPVVVPPDLPAAIIDQIRAMISTAPPTAARAEDQEAMVLATSGSTGVPKLVVLAQRSFSVSVPYLAGWYAQPDTAQILIATPMYTNRTLVNNALPGLYCGWTLHLFSPSTPGSVLQRQIRSRGITVLGGTASFFRLFLRYGSGEAFPSVTHVSTGGESVPEPLVRQMRAAFPNASAHVTLGAGEAGTRIASISMEDPRSRAGAVGPAVPYMDTRIAPVPEVKGPAGELLLRGPTMFLGYLQQDGSYTGLDAEGFFHTGDLARADESGCLYHLGRIGGLVKVGGLFVNPTEVEQAIQEVPGVAEVLCWIEAHPILGKVLAAQIVPMPGVTLTQGSLRRECQARMEKHMVPYRIEIVDALAQAASGKRLLKPPGADAPKTL